MEKNHRCDEYPSPKSLPRELGLMPFRKQQKQQNYQYRQTFLSGYYKLEKSQRLQPSFFYHHQNGINNMLNRCIHCTQIAILTKRDDNKKRECT